jgi:uncharacterized protein YecT (DUF1311 family)
MSAGPSRVAAAPDNSQPSTRSDQARGANCRDLIANSEQKKCVEAQYRKAVVGLEAAYARALERASKVDAQRALKAGAGEKNWAAAVAESQHAWEIYRDAECNGVVGSGGGSGRIVWVWGCLVEKTSARIIELNTPFDQR